MVRFAWMGAFKQQCEGWTGGVWGRRQQGPWLRGSCSCSGERRGGWPGQSVGQWALDVSLRWANVEGRFKSIFVLLYVWWRERGVVRVGLQIPRWMVESAAVIGRLREEKLSKMLIYFGTWCFCGSHISGCRGWRSIGTTSQKLQEGREHRDNLEIPSKKADSHPERQ